MTSTTVDGMDRERMEPDPDDDGAWDAIRPAAAALITAFIEQDETAYKRIIGRWASKDSKVSVQFTTAVAIMAGAMLTGAVGGDTDKARGLAQAWVADAVGRRAVAVDAEAIADQPHAA